jgi:hypothetical protein
LSEVKWSFAESNENEGFNASQIAIFSGDSSESITRETIQNSLDARDDHSQPVKVKFEILKLTQEQCPEAFALAPWIDRASTAQSEVKNNKEAEAFYANAKKVLKSQQIRILAVHDSNTKGLGGPTAKTRGIPDGGWISLVQSSGESNQSSDASGGAFGIGGKAPYAMSELRTLFYLSKTQYENREEIRFQGKAILQSMWLNDSGDERSGKTGFYGKASENGTCNPLLDAYVPSWASINRMKFSSTSGTSLFVLAPHASDEEESFWHGMYVAVLANFYYAIFSGNLSVEIADSEVIDSSSIKKIFTREILEKENLVSTYSDTVRESLESSRTIFADSEGDMEERKFVTSSFGEIMWFLRMDQSVRKSAVGVARQNGMLITRDAEKLRSFQGYIPFDMFVCVVDLEGSKILRRFENPEHNRFELSRVQDKEEKRALTKAYLKFTDDIRQLIGTKAEAKIKEILKSADMNHIFRGEGNETEGSSEDEASLDTVFKKPKPRAIVQGERTRVSGTEETGSAGKRGGDGTAQSSGGDNDDPGGDATKIKDAFTGVQVKNLRIGSLEDTGFASIHFTPVVQGNGNIRFLKSGASEKVLLEFRVRQTDEWVTEMPLTGLDTSRRMLLKLQFHADDLKYKIEAVISK